MGAQFNPWKILLLKRCWFAIWQIGCKRSSMLDHLFKYFTVRKQACSVCVKQKTGLIPSTCGTNVQGGDSSCIWNQNHKTWGKWSKFWEVFVLKQLYSIHNLYEWQMIMKHFSKVPTRFENSSPPQSTLQWCARSSKSSLQTGRDIKI
jgi:hypothetical protein